MERNFQELSFFRNIESLKAFVNLPKSFPSCIQLLKTLPVLLRNSKENRPLSKTVKGAFKEPHPINIKCPVLNVTIAQRAQPMLLIQQKEIVFRTGKNLNVDSRGNDRGRTIAHPDCAHFMKGNLVTQIKSQIRAIKNSPIKMTIDDTPKANEMLLTLDIYDSFHNVCT